MNIYNTVKQFRIFFDEHISNKRVNRLCIRQNDNKEKKKT